MSPAEFGVNFFVAMFALIDPVGNVPMFAAATSRASPAGRRWTALYISLFALGILVFFFVTGLRLLQFFGISLPAFRIAGGVLLLLLGLDMTRGDMTMAADDPAAEHEAVDARGYARRSFERLVAPFAMPLLIGPGAISATIIYAGEAQPYGVTGWLVGLVAVAAVAGSILLTFLLTPLISRVLGRVGMAITVRVAGLILCAMAVQFLITGLNEATHGLVRQSVAAPYADKARPGH
jgi:multiple antibiotic resistance protein